jgi:hypothetical protein
MGVFVTRPISGAFIALSVLIVALQAFFAARRALRTRGEALLAREMPAEAPRA